jgi:Large polyvalent protein associated domain 38
VEPVAPSPHSTEALQDALEAVTLRDAAGKAAASAAYEESGRRKAKAAGEAARAEVQEAAEEFIGRGPSFAEARDAITVERAEQARAEIERIAPDHAGPAYAQWRRTYPMASPIAISADGLDRMARYWQDAWNPVKKWSAAMKEEGVLTDAADPYLQEELRRGRTKKAIEREAEKYVRPIRDAIAKSELDIGDVELYLMARHAPERNAHILALNGRPNGSGMTDAEAARIVAAAQASPHAAAYSHIASLSDALGARTRALWVDYGLESQELVDALEQRWTSFVPLRSDPDVETVYGERPMRTGGGAQVRGREFKAALGRSTVGEMPLTFMAMDLESAIQRGERNRVFRSAYEAAKATNDPNLVLVDVPPTKQTVTNGVVRTVPSFELQEQEVVGKIDGELRRIRFAPQLTALARAMKNLDAESGGAVVQGIGKATRLIAGLSTRWNPMFGPVNVSRDVLGAGANITSEEGAGAAAKALSPARIGWAMKQLSAKGPWASRYEASGAPVSFLDFGPDAKARAKQMIAEIDALRSPNAPWTMTRRYASNVARAVDWVNGIGENATRLAAFRHAVEDLGMSDERAASYAKNITTNFERHGNAQWLNALFAFSNAGIQGSTRVAQALSTKGGRKLAGALLVGAVAQALLNRSIGGDDDDGIPFYDKIPAWVKRSHAIVMLPGGDYLKIPLPFVWGWFHSSGAALGDVMSGAISPARAAMETLVSAVDQVNPLGGGGEPIETLTPTILDPLVQIAAEKDWTGRKLYPTAYGDPALTPDSERVWDDTNPVLVEITRALNAIGGGSRAKSSGALDISPITLQHLWRSYTGGLGGEAARTTGTVGKWISGEETTTADYPLVRRYFGEIAMRDQRQVYRDHVRLVDEAAKLEKVGEPHDAGLYRLRLRAKVWKDKIGDLEDAIRATDNAVERKALRGKLTAVMHEATLAVRKAQNR